MKLTIQIKPEYAALFSAVLKIRQKSTSELLEGLL